MAEPRPNCNLPRNPDGSIAVEGLSLKQLDDLTLKEVKPIINSASYWMPRLSDGTLVELTNRQADDLFLSSLRRGWALPIG